MKMNSCSAQSAAGANEFWIVSGLIPLANAGFLQGTYCYRLSDFNGVILPPPPRLIDKAGDPFRNGMRMIDGKRQLERRDRIARN
jgi:hypothetical protein